MGIEHEILGTVVERSYHSAITDLQIVFSKLIHKLHYVMYALLIFFINQCVIK